MAGPRCADCQCSQRSTSARSRASAGSNEGAGLPRRQVARDAVRLPQDEVAVHGHRDEAVRIKRPESGRARRFRTDSPDLEAVWGTWEAVDFHARHCGPRVCGRSSPPSRRERSAWTHHGAHIYDDGGAGKSSL
jgi:hypothetical protein